MESGQQCDFSPGIKSVESMPGVLKSLKIRALAYYLYCRRRQRPMQMLVVFRSYQNDQYGAVSNQLTNIGRGGDCVGVGVGVTSVDVTEGVFYTLYTLSSNRE